MDPAHHSRGGKRGYCDDGFSSRPNRKRRRFQHQSDNHDQEQHSRCCKLTGTYAAAHRTGNTNSTALHGQSNSSVANVSVAAEVQSIIQDYLSGVPDHLPSYFTVWAEEQWGIVDSWKACQTEHRMHRGSCTHEKVVRYDDLEEVLTHKLTRKITNNRQKEAGERARQNNRQGGLSREIPTTSSSSQHYSAATISVSSASLISTSGPSVAGASVPAGTSAPAVGSTAAVGSMPTATSAPITAAASRTADESPEHEEPSAPAGLPQTPPLCQEQQHGLDLALQGHNLFVTGSGGCGKSVLVKCLFRELKTIGKSVHLLAPTGLAALNVGGRTTFAYAGWGADAMSKKSDVLNELAKGNKVWSRFTGTDVLIIDEISMVEKMFFDRFSSAMCSARKDSNPFGGVQIIVVGDFCQLPPVKPFEWCPECSRKTWKPRGSTNHLCPTGHAVEDQEKWAFKSDAWHRCNFEYVHLTKIHRQQDEEFVKVLQKCRSGTALDAADKNLLLRRQPAFENGARLYSRRKDVQEHNSMELNSLPGHPRRFRTLDRFDWRGDDSEQDLRSYKKIARTSTDAPPSWKPLEKLKDHRYPTCLELKLGMPVILLANIDLERGLCNGSQGTICGFKPYFDANERKPPQSKHYRNDEAGFRGAEEKHRQVGQYFLSDDSLMDYPEVMFADGQRRVIGPDCSITELGSRHPYSLLSRTQIPLAPGWAMTIHKSQSLTLDRVIVNLDNIFEHGQAYVALSRVKTLQGLRLEGVTESDLDSLFHIDPAVATFLMEMDSRRNRQQAVVAQQQRGPPTQLPDGPHRIDSAAVREAHPHVYPNGISNVYPNGISNVYPNGISNAHPNGILNVHPNGISNVYPNGISHLFSNGNSHAYPNGNSNVYSNGISHLYPNGNSYGYLPQHSQWLDPRSQPYGHMH